MDNNFLKGLAIGFVVGAIASVIFMPESGRKVADKVREQARFIKQKIKEKGEDLGEIEEEASEFVSSLISRGKMTKDEALNLRKHLAEFIKEN